MPALIESDRGRFAMNSVRRLCWCSALLFLIAAALSATEPVTLDSLPRAAVPPAVVDQALSWGDQGDGTYRNPVLPADFSDPDAVRVDDDFFLVASEFHFIGMQVLHSRDLENWDIIGQVLHRFAVQPKYDAMTAYAEGTWAPTLRHHAGIFYVYVCTPHDGLCMWHAKNPAGPWSETVTVKNLDVVKVDAEQNLLLVKGAVPGAKGALLTIRQA